MVLINHWNNQDTDGLQSYFRQRDATGAWSRRTLSVTAYMEPFRVRLNGATRCSG